MAGIRAVQLAYIVHMEHLIVVLVRWMWEDIIDTTCK